MIWVGQIYLTWDQNIMKPPTLINYLKSGITFLNGYASSAICAPSRATMMSENIILVTESIQSVHLKED